MITYGTKPQIANKFHKLWSVSGVTDAPSGNIDSWCVWWTQLLFIQVHDWFSIGNRWIIVIRCELDLFFFNLYSFTFWDCAFLWRKLETCVFLQYPGVRRLNDNDRKVSYIGSIRIDMHIENVMCFWLKIATV